MEEIKNLIVSVEKNWKDFLKKQKDGDDETIARAHDRLSFIIPIYCHQESNYYRNSELLPFMREGLDQLLKRQLESGCISLENCNIDSPPDTAFAVHIVALLYQLVERSGMEEISDIKVGLYTFLKGTRPCLLTGGIHTPNHRWVMCGALAKMYEIFEDVAFKERAFQFLDEGFDITDYGEWTERSNAIYNSACAIHLYDVGSIFGYEQAFEAIEKNLLMMRYLIHPGDFIVTEYSGRQDAGQKAMFNSWYDVTVRLMANKTGDRRLLSLAKKITGAALPSPMTLVYWMLYPEKMKLPENVKPLSNDYTVLFGEGNEIAVPTIVPYGKRKGHPHGAPVLRHRRGKLSVTVMAAQQTLLYFQYGKARMFGLKLTAGWFGIGAVAFPTIKKTGDEAYSMQVELEGNYWQPLTNHLVQHSKGKYVDMPNHLREKSHSSKLQLTVNIQLHDDGVELEVISENMANIFLQNVFMFDQEGQIEGESLVQKTPTIIQLLDGDAVYQMKEDCIRISGGMKEHHEISMRNDHVNRDAQNLTVNFVTPSSKKFRISGFERNS